MTAVVMKRPPRAELGVEIQLARLRVLVATWRRGHYRERLGGQRPSRRHPSLAGVAPLRSTKADFRPPPAGLLAVPMEEVVRLHLLGNDGK
jgi:hypothetical protein